MTLREAFESKMLLLDGGMGSVIQTYGIKGANNDMLSIERPDVILDIQRRYVDAGVDCLTTNTFSSQRVSQHEYHQEHRIAEMNRASVAIAKQAAAEAMEKYGRKVYILGDVGPTSKMLSMSEDVNDPANRSITFDELEDAYLEQIQVLVEEGVDAILIETIFDTLNAKAAASAYMKVKDAMEAAAVARGETPRPLEVMFSMTVSDASGRTLSGQTVEAFAISVMHAKPLSIGLNCGLGADGMVPYLRRMGKLAPCYISCHPNAGLPNQFGGYDDTPEDMVQKLKPYMDEKLVNMVGGCCGTTPEHVAAMRKMLDALPADYERRKPAPAFVTSPRLRLAGLEPLLVNQVRPSNGAESCNAEDFVPVGERCNVAGSKKFLRLINEKNYDEALDIARKQVEDGAQVIDVNMDDGLLDAKQEMRTFLNLLASDPAISRVPIMVDSSRFEVIEEGLKCAQGKCIVNSISLKMGEEAFVEHAMTVKRLGAAVIVMLFDEEGQATNYDRRVEIASRAYKIVTEKCGFDPSDIIFDPNVLTVATGMAEHNAYAHDFIRACRWIIDNLPGVRISGGLSNLSFAFRGNNYLREAMHSAMLHYATPNGMGMAIMNPAAAVEYKSIPMELRMAITEVLFNTHPEASEELIEIAGRMNAAQQAAKESGAKYDPKAIFAVSVGAGSNAGDDAAAEGAAVQTTPEQRLQEALLKGTSNTLQPDLMELINRGDSPVNIISGPLMDGMNEVGRLFGEGKMFLPQVVKTARTMKKAVEILQPYIEAGKSADGAAASRGKIVIATVKGDVHDIGKNIVSVIMACNGFEMVDLGVMVPEDVIVKAAIENKADILSLSGLITPSLEEMCTVATKMQEAGLRIPIIVGGATTSPTHTAVKIAPCYDGPVFHVRDAASNPGLAAKLLDPATREQTIEENRQEQQRIRDEQSGKIAAKAVAMAAAESTPLERRFACDWSKYSPVQPPFMGESKLPPITLEKVIPLISWEYFFYTWKVKADCEEAKKLKADAEALLKDLNKPEYSLRAVQAFYAAAGTDDSVVFNTARTGTAEDLVEVATARQQNPEGTCLALCDYVAPADSKTASVYSSVAGDKVFRDIVGAFAVTVSDTFVKRLEKLKSEQGGSDYDVLLMQTVADRLAEAGAEYLSRELAANNGWNGIRPAVGYPVLPNIKEIFNVAKLIDFDSVGISLTENGAMYPQASVSGLYISHPEIEYFNVKV